MACHLDHLPFYLSQGKKKEKSVMYQVLALYVNPISYE